MSTTAEEYTADGAVLNTYAFNISTWTGRGGIPPVTGENLNVGQRPGAVWVPKEFGQREETWAMWALGCNEDGSFPADHSRRAQFNANMDKLRRIFGKRRSQIEVTRKLWLPTDGGEELVEQHALAECVSTLDPTTMAGATRATFSATMRFADPFWYSDDIDYVVTGETPDTVINPGSATAKKIIATLVGPLTFPRIQVAETGSELRLNYVIPSGRTVTVNTDLFTVVDDLNVNLISTVTNSGTPFWIELDPGVSTVTVDNHMGGALGAGTVELTVSPPYL